MEETPTENVSVESLISNINIPTIPIEFAPKKGGTAQQKEETSPNNNNNNDNVTNNGNEWKSLKEKATKAFDEEGWDFMWEELSFLFCHL